MESEPAHERKGTYHIGNQQGSGKPAHKGSLSRAFAVHRHIYSRDLGEASGKN